MDQPAASETKVVTPTIAREIKQAIHDIITLYRGYGVVRIEIRAGAITRIGLDLWTWNRKDKEDGC